MSAFGARGRRTLATLSNGDHDVDFSRCSSCKAQVLWAQTEQGKRMPLDAMPVADGTFFVFAPDDPRADLRCINVRADNATAQRWKREGRSRFKSHFATCPRANEHRRASR